MPSTRGHPTLEVSDCGTYARFGARRPVARTLLLSSWPLVALDLDRRGRVIGIETIPLPSGGRPTDNVLSGAR